ncbi:hypothetical protein RKD26_002338 [Streptomyces calvus]|uniref:hypothetical protein n=1 Tax=Streptomyces calvus TaxID=67282 RepID=UPI003599F700
MPGLFATHQSISARTHGDAAASGEAITTSQRERASARSMSPWRSGLAARWVMSRNTRSRTGRYQGRPKFSMPRWKTVATSRSRCWL